MEIMGNGRRPRRSFSDEYKTEVVELCRTSGKSIAQVARDLGIGETAVRRWVALRPPSIAGCKSPVTRSTYTHCDLALPTLVQATILGSKPPWTG